MSRNHEAAKVLKRAKELLNSGKFGDLMIHRSGRIEQPIPVFGPKGKLHSWFVPVTVGELLVGFFEFRSDLTLMRYSSFQRREGSLEGCPVAKLWIDADIIRQQALKNAMPGEKILKTFLTYDRVPSHLAWMVVLQSPEGTARALFVAGGSVWQSGNTPDISSFESR